jgi:cyclopropane-fatty-acyl-phospholipid synthase
MTTTRISEDSAATTSLVFLRDVFANYHPRDFAVRLWNGQLWPPEPGQQARFTMVLKHPGALRRMFWPPTELTAAEAYLHDDFDVEGDIEGINLIAPYVLGRRQHHASSLVKLGRDFAALLALPDTGQHRQGRQPATLAGRRHSVRRDREAVTYHYNVSNDFYALFLDSRMVYSCAYFGSPDDDLDTAQARKLDYICRKLRLQPGMRLLDIGCGWGGLVMHAAERYGCDCTGITLSQPQADLAGERIVKAGLRDRCRVLVRDYREVDEPAAYDRIVSVGMFEHVGQALLPAYMARAWSLLKPGGTFLNHGIACTVHDQRPAGPSFSDRYVFPDGELEPISVSLRAAEDAGFEVRDVESLREHYMLTLRHWVRRLEASHEAALKSVDEVTYRVWRLYMSGSADGFRAGRLNVYQSLLVKPDDGRSGLPLTRGDWYR